MRNRQPFYKSSWNCCFRKKWKIFLNKVKGEKDSEKVKKIVEDNYNNNPDMKEDFEKLAKYIEEKYPKDFKIFCKNYIEDQEIKNSIVNF